jgi:hypothetical protein
LAAGECLRSGDEMLVVDVRAAGCSTSPERLLADTHISQLAADGGGQHHWQQMSIDEFAAGAPSGTRTVVWVHGNRISRADACSRGMRVYKTLTQFASDEDPPIRFVIFSWPADQQPGLLRDFREKALRTRPVAWQLAYLLNQLPADEPISLAGYSYGARVIGGTLHLLAGGDLGCGLVVEGASAGVRPPMPVVFIAPATHCNWFGPQQFHGLALSQVDGLLFTINRADPAMKYYEFVDKNTHCDALGLNGTCCAPPVEANRLSCVDMTRAVGGTHDLFAYMCVSSYMSRAWHTLVP